MSCSSAPVTATSRSMPGKRGADRADRLGDSQAVLEQAVPVGLVVVLRRRGHPVAGPQLRVLGEHALEQHAQVTSPGSSRPARAPRLPSGRPRARARRAAQRDRSSRGRRARGSRRLIWGPKRGMHRVAAAHPHRRAGARQLLHLGRAPPRPCTRPHPCGRRAAGAGSRRHRAAGGALTRAPAGPGRSPCRRSARSGAWLEGRRGCGRDARTARRPPRGVGPSGLGYRHAIECSSEQRRTCRCERCGRASESARDGRQRWA